MNDVLCEKCQTYYAVEVRETKEAKGIVIQFFSCPHCGKSNVVSATNKALNKRGCIWADGEIIRGLGMLGSYGVRDRQAIDSLLHVSQILPYEAARSYLASYQREYREFYAVQKVGHLHAFVLFAMIDERKAGESDAT